MIWGTDASHVTKIDSLKGIRVRSAVLYRHNMGLHYFVHISEGKGEYICALIC
jgi:hypothetical protein